VVTGSSAENVGLLISAAQIYLSRHKLLMERGASRTEPLIRIGMTYPERGEFHGLRSVRRTVGKKMPHQSTSPHKGAGSSRLTCCLAKKGCCGRGKKVSREEEKEISSNGIAFGERCENSNLGWLGPGKLTILIADAHHRRGCFWRDHDLLWPNLECWGKRASRGADGSCEFSDRGRFAFVLLARFWGTRYQGRRKENFSEFLKDAERRWG